MERRTVEANLLSLGRWFESGSKEVSFDNITDSSDVTLFKSWYFCIQNFSLFSLRYFLKLSSCYLSEGKLSSNLTNFTSPGSWIDILRSLIRIWLEGIFLTFTLQITLLGYHFCSYYTSVIVSKRICFEQLRDTIGLKKLACLFHAMRSKMKPILWLVHICFPAPCDSYRYLLEVPIGSLDCRLWLARVITLVLVLALSWKLFFPCIWKMLMSVKILFLLISLDNI